MNQPLYYFSRNYVEFGTFTAPEILDFYKRGILKDQDYVRSVETETWETMGQWVTTGIGKEAKPAKKAAAPRKKAAAATKASKKAA